MSRFDAADCGLLRNQEEVEALVFSVLNEFGVNDGTWWWIHHSIILLAKHSLVDPLVNNDECDFGRIDFVVLFKK